MRQNYVRGTFLFGQDGRKLPDLPQNFRVTSDYRRVLLQVISKKKRQTAYKPGSVPDRPKTDGG